MKKLIYCLLFLLPIYLSIIGCESGISGYSWYSDESPEPTPHPPCQMEEFDEEMTDSRDGQDYGIVDIDGTYWMAKNLNYKTDDSWWYDDDPDLGAIYGRLYTWDAARQACPDGWRLPTDEEWIALITYFDPGYDTTNSLYKGDAFNRLVTCNSDGFNAQMGGYRYGNSSYSQMGGCGYYWSDTEKTPGYPLYYSFQFNNRRLFRNVTHKPEGYSCRCVKN